MISKVQPEGRRVKSASIAIAIPTIRTIDFPLAWRSPIVVLARTAMRLGLNLPAHSTSLAATIEVVVEAERNGFETLYLTEQHLAPGKGFANPYAVASAISGRLQQACIGVRPALGMQHPLETVEQSNLLDLLTRGRSLMVLADNVADSAQYASFGLPVPRFDQLVEQMLRAWSWRFVEDSPPLEFSAGAHSSRMAGRIMPAPCRQPHPLLAREARDEATAEQAACRGWPVQLLGPNAHSLVRSYRDALARGGHPQSTVEECLRWLVIVLEVSPDSKLQDRLRECEQSGAAEVRLDPVEGLPIKALLEMNIKR